jgi:hypothetical protein
MRGMRVCSLRDQTRMDGQTVGWNDGRERSTKLTDGNFQLILAQRCQPGNCQIGPRIGHRLAL